MGRTLVGLILLVFVAVGCASDGDRASTPSATNALSPSPEERTADPVYAYIDATRADLSDGKARLINQVMRLTREESAKFWPIYHEYEGELFAIGDQRVELSRRFVVAQATETFDDKGAAALADDWFRIESHRLDLIRKYHKQIAGELSPLRAVQFTQIEHRVATVIDLMIASELPLVRTAAGR